MAANRNRYADNKLEVYKDGTTYSTLVAKMTTDYTNEATIKQIFKLDYVHEMNDGQFIGGVLISGSENLKFHDTSNINVDGTANSKGDAAAHQRFSHLRVRETNGNIYALFNDAGLNTKPDCAFVNISDITPATPFLLWAGYNKSRVAANFVAARFVNTVNRKIEVYKGSTLIDSFDNGNANQNTSQVIEQILDTKNLAEGDSVTLKITTVNAEGSIIMSMTASVGATVDLPYLFARYEDLGGLPDMRNPVDNISLYKFASADLNSVTTEDKNTGIYLYTDDRMNRAVSTRPNTPPDGWYNTSGNKYYRVINGEVRYYYQGNAQAIKTGLQPCIIGNNIGIECVSAALSGSVTVQSISYYDSATSTNQQGSQTINKTYTNLAIGQRVDTGIAINKMGDYARFSLSSTAIANPIVMLMSMDFGDR